MAGYVYILLGCGKMSFAGSGKGHKENLLCCISAQLSQLSPLSRTYL